VAAIDVSKKKKYILSTRASECRLLCNPLFYAPSGSTSFRCVAHCLDWGGKNHTDEPNAYTPTPRSVRSLIWQIFEGADKPLSRLSHKCVVCHFADFKAMNSNDQLIFLSSYWKHVMAVAELLTVVKLYR